MVEASSKPEESGEADAKPEWRGGWGIPGLQDALVGLLEPVQHMDTESTLEENVKLVQKHFNKGSNRLQSDDRCKDRGSTVEAQIVVEEFVSTVLTAVNAACYDKDWLTEVDFSNALVVTAKYTFRSSKLFCRTLGSLLKKYVDDSVLRFREEDRIAKVIHEALSMSGLNETLIKKASKDLVYSFDEAHMWAPYGSTGAASQELGLVQDFVKYWMTSFATEATDVLEEGGGGDKEEQFAFMTNLFNYMCDPARSILPQDIVGQLENPLPENWPFIGEQAMTTLKEIDENPSKRQKTGGWGKGGDKGWGGGW